jgi:hypothetical protein
LISQANALIIDTKPFCLSEAARDNGTNITAFAHTFDERMQKMEVLDSNIHAAGIRGGVGNPTAVLHAPILANAMTCCCTNKRHGQYALVFIFISHYTGV